MKKKTVYIWMGTIVGLTVVLYAVISLFHLQDKAINVADNIQNLNGTPTINSYFQGDLSSPLEKPMDVAKIGEYVYVSDTNHQQVQVFNSVGKFAFKFGKKGTGEGEFQFPYGITGDSEGKVYVADLYNNRISIFDSKGKFLKYFTDDSKKPDFLKSPGGLRIYNDKLFVTSIQLNRVIEYSLDGKKILEITAAATKDDTLNAPNAVTVDSDRNIYVSDTGNQRVVVYDKNGKFIRIINGSEDGKSDSKFVNPRGIGVEQNGTLLLVDNMTHYIYGFDKEGRQIFQFGGLGAEKDQFYLPNGLFVDSDGEVFITDTVNGRIAFYN